MKNYKDFFQKHIKQIKKDKEVCRECGCSLKGSVREVAHILPKSYFKSVSKNDNNIIYLCEKHHTEFDNFPNSEIKKMYIFPFIAKRFKYLETIIKERINYKIYERYE